MKNQAPKKTSERECTSTTPPAAVISLSLHEQLLFVCVDVYENVMKKFFHAFTLNVHTLIAETDRHDKLLL